jgi:hypothetical protein
VVNHGLVVLDGIHGGDVGVAPAVVEKQFPAAREERLHVRIYEHAHYLGQSAHITQDIADLKDA